MYLLIDNLLGAIHQKNDKLETLTDNLLKKLYAGVWQGDLCENTYRNVYHGIQNSKNIKELNDILEYEIGFKILVINQ